MNVSVTAHWTDTDSIGDAFIEQWFNDIRTTMFHDRMVADVFISNELQLTRLCVAQVEGVIEDLLLVINGTEYRFEDGRNTAVFIDHPVLNVATDLLMRLI